ncbi:TraX family protein [Pseudomonas sp. SP16.1]|uniref:TraX family protein n=1 Tax=Pseudomonas sp. SP16.1 TaxID=3458854 RepID=UPI004045B238
MKRDAGLDLVKWLAMLSMLIDHLRHLWPDAYGLFVIGRLAFPLFCLGIAANVVRTRPGELFSEGNARYLGWLLAFSLLSELPYSLLSPESATLNVMPTLSLGLLVAWGVHHADRNSLLLTVGTLAIALLLHRQLMYGVVGVMLPAAFVLGLRGARWWWLPAAMAVLANSRNRWLVEWGTVPETLAMLAMAGAAVVLGLALLRQPMSCKVWPVGRWGYWFYPGHLAVIYLMKP